MQAKTWCLVLMTVAGLLGGSVGCSYHYDRDHGGYHDRGPHGWHDR